MEARDSNRDVFSVSKNQPKDGLEGLKQNWKDDLVSGILVSLIALPLCLGIAMASGFPAFGGIITAIIGGLFVGPLCGSQLSIKGPAAGLIAIAIAAVEALGEGNLAEGYRYTLAVVVVAGLVQVVFASLKFGRFSDFFPSSAVHGMLAAIGIIIFSKQIHPLLGVKPTSKNPIELLMEIPNSIANLNPAVALIGFCAVAILLIGPKLMGKYSRYLPAQLLTVLICIPIGQYLDLSHEHIYTWHSHSYNLTSKELVNLPANFFAGVTFPNFSKIFTATSFQYILMFALIGSLESMLTVKAVDGLDPYKRKADANKDLFILGLGNSICGLLGGLPMISEVVRSFANVSNGAKTRWANFFHGLALLVFVLLVPDLIHRIPVASLSAILCVTGYRLASPKHFIEVKEIGFDQFLVFTVTVVGTLATDLLIGVGLGIATEYALCALLAPSYKNLIKNKMEVVKYSEDKIHVNLPAVCYFGNILKFNSILKEYPNHTFLFNFNKSILVDHTFIRRLSEVRKEYQGNGRPVQIKDMDKLTPISSHEYSLRRMKVPIHDKVTMHKNS